MVQKTLLSQRKFETILNRLACQLIEKHKEFNNTVLIGLQPRGIFLLNRLISILEESHNIQNISHGKLDVTFFRDDFRRSETILSPKSTEMEVVVENKSVVLIDDVLYTGRSIRAALTALDSFGRPSEVELLVLIDRRFSRHLPIQPDYLGAQIDAIHGDRVRVEWNKNGIENIVYIEEK